MELVTFLLKWGLGIIFILGIVVGVFSLLLGRFHGGNQVKEPEVDLELEPVEDDFDWDAVHDHVGISLARSSRGTRTEVLEDLSEEEIAEEQVKYFRPQVSFEPDGIVLTYENVPNRYPAIAQLKRAASQYSEILWKHQKIPVPNVWPEEHKYPWVFKFRFVTPEVKERLSWEQDFSEFKITDTTPTGEVRFPQPGNGKSYFDGDDLVFDIARCPVELKAFESALGYWSAKFHKNYQSVAKDKLGRVRLTHLKPRTDILFKFGDTIFSKFEAWTKDLLEVMRVLALKVKMEVVFMGEVQDPLVSLPTKALTDINNFVHMVVVGKTGSGKSTTLISWIYHSARLNKAIRPAGGDEDLWFFGDGKDGGDFVIPAKYLSKYPVATKNVELVNIIKLVWGEYRRRQTLFADVRKQGIPCRNIYEYRENVGWLPRVYVIIDEFKAFILDMDFDALKESNGSLPYMLTRLLAEARSAGFTFVFASQRYQQDTFPTVIRSNLTTKMVHRLEGTDTAVLGGLSIPVNFDKGDYLLMLDGFSCDKTGQGAIHCRMPLIGKNGGEVEELFTRDFSKKEWGKFDYDLIYNDGNLENLDKADLSATWRFAKKLFLQEQGFEVLEQYCQDHKVDTVDICVSFKDPRTGLTYGLGMIESLSDLADTLHKRNRALLEKLAPHQVLFMLDFDLKNKDEEALADFKENGVYPANFIFIPKSLYLKPLKKAFADYEEEKANHFFQELIDDLRDDNEADETEAKAARAEAAELVASGKSAAVDPAAPTVDDKVTEYRQRMEELDRKIAEKMAVWKAKAKPEERRILDALEGVEAPGTPPTKPKAE